MNQQRSDRLAELKRKHRPEPPPEPERIGAFSMNARMAEHTKDAPLHQIRGRTGTASLDLVGDEIVLTDFDGTEKGRATVSRNTWVYIQGDASGLTAEPLWTYNIGPQGLEIGQFVIARVSEFAPQILLAVQAILEVHGPIWMTWTPGPVCSCCMGEGEPSHQMSMGTVTWRDNGEVESTYNAGPWWLPHVDYPCLTVRLLASQWADHPAFRDQWRADRWHDDEESGMPAVTVATSDGSEPPEYKWEQIER